MKVLVSAYACEPHKGSEPGVGWQWTKQIARFHEVWVVTRANNRKAIENECHRNPVANLHFSYVDLPAWASFWKKGQKGIYLYYYVWQTVAYRLARRLHERIRFDVAHHITFGNVWMPTFMPLLGIPFIWGPVGGSERVPEELKAAFSTKWRAYEMARDLLLFFTFRLDPFARMAMDKASLIITRTAITAAAFPAKYKAKIRTMIETGVSEEFLNQMSRAKRERKGNTILMAGRLLHWKGFDLGIEGFARLAYRQPNARLIIMGSGPEQDHLQRLATSFHLDDRIQFRGHQPREEVLGVMAGSDVFLMPSMKDAGTWVLFEAMAAGLPVVCLDYAGPAEIVNNSCAIKVSPASRARVVGGIEEALDRLLLSEKLRTEMGREGRKRLRDDFLWETKAKNIAQFYQDLPVVSWFEGCST